MNEAQIANLIAVLHTIKDSLYRIEQTLKNKS